jgi:hypothetical protein
MAERHTTYQLHYFRYLLSSSPAICLQQTLGVSSSGESRKSTIEDSFAFGRNSVLPLTSSKAAVIQYQHWTKGGSRENKQEWVLCRTGLLGAELLQRVAASLTSPSAVRSAFARVYARTSISIAEPLKTSEIRQLKSPRARRNRQSETHVVCCATCPQIRGSFPRIISTITSQSTTMICSVLETMCCVEYQQTQRGNLLGRA